MRVIGFETEIYHIKKSIVRALPADIKQVISSGLACSIKL